MEITMQRNIREIFAQYLNFLPSDAVEKISTQFLQRYASLYSSAPSEEVPIDRLGEVESFLFEKIKETVRQNPRLDLRYPDQAIQNIVLLLLDRIDCARAARGSNAASYSNRSSTESYSDKLS